ncbi:MAG TPA: NAD(P)-dependent oxidoreductase [Spirochaetia bacterium]|nr:NAD(P)-dependent oxidoreductase [Spirochaetia bacterium]
MQLKVLIADKLSPAAVDALAELGASVRLEPDLTADALPDNVGDAEVLVVRSTKVSRATIEAARELSLIVRAGAGVNTIDIEAASEYGVSVANCPGKNTAAVAELAVGLMICADRRIPAATADLVAGNWRKKEYGKASGLHGRTVGIVGFGSIGRAFAVRAQALGMRVCAWSRSLTSAIADEAGVEYCAGIIDVAERSDVVSVHLAVSSETKGLIGSEFFGAMRDGATFINTSRGEIVDQDALASAISTRGIQAALDVYADEPSGGEADFGDTAFAALLSAATPHIGASTDQAAEAIAAETVRVIESYIQTGKPVNAVNIRAKAAKDVSLVVRHYNQVGVLASVLDELKDAGINVEEMENTIFQGGTTATCSLKLDKAPSAGHLDRMRTGEHIIQVMLK